MARCQSRLSAHEMRSNVIGAQLPARILVVDDHLEARTTIRHLLDWHGYEVCGEAKDGKEAIEQVRELTPDIVLLDINMPDMNGIQAALEIRRFSPETKIVFFTIHESPVLMNSLRSFAHGFVSKSAAGTELIGVVSRLAGPGAANWLKAKQ
jgi:DNA-binding NarL/FixJ family response regulator